MAQRIICLKYSVLGMLYYPLSSRRKMGPTLEAPHEFSALLDGLAYVTKPYIRLRNGESVPRQSDQLPQEKKHLRRCHSGYLSQVGSSGRKKPHLGGGIQGQSCGG